MGIDGTGNLLIGRLTLSYGCNILILFKDIKKLMLSCKNLHQHCLCLFNSKGLSAFAVTMGRKRKKVQSQGRSSQSTGERINKASNMYCGIVM